MFGRVSGAFWAKRGRLWTMSKILSVQGGTHRAKMEPAWPKFRPKRGKRGKTQCFSAFFVGASVEHVETPLAVRLQWLPSLFDFSFAKWKTWKKHGVFLNFGGRERG